MRNTQSVEAIPQELLKKYLIYSKEKAHPKLNLSGSLTHHGFSAQLRVELGDLVLVHLVELGVRLLLAVDQVLLQQLLRYRLHALGVAHLLRMRIYSCVDTGTYCCMNAKANQTCA